MKILYASPIHKENAKTPAKSNRESKASACRPERKGHIMIIKSANGGTWDELQKEIFTPEEIAVSNLRAALIGELVKARQEKGLSQKKLEALCGVKQPIIARIEKGSTIPPSLIPS